MGYPGRIKGGIWVESGVIGAETAENLCWGFGCREEGFFAKVSEDELKGRLKAVMRFSDDLFTPFIAISSGLTTF